jgi:hypothetical protein
VAGRAQARRPLATARSGAGQRVRPAPPRRHRHAHRLARGGIGPTAAAGDPGAVHERPSARRRHKSSFAASASTVSSSAYRTAIATNSHPMACALRCSSPGPMPDCSGPNSPRSCPRRPRFHAPPAPHSTAWPPAAYPVAPVETFGPHVSTLPQGPQARRFQPGRQALAHSPVSGFITAIILGRCSWERGGGLNRKRYHQYDEPLSRLYFPGSRCLLLVLCRATANERRI